jgi:YjbR
MKFETARQFALSLPEVTEEPHFQMASFRIRGKIFATAPPGDEFLHLFVDEQQREQLFALEPDCCEKLWWGKKVVGKGVCGTCSGVAAVRVAAQGAEIAAQAA